MKLLKPTPSDIEGPFYKADAPFRESLVKDSTLTILGKIYNEDGDVLPAAILEYWQADEKGDYDLEGWHLRGRGVVNEHGDYQFNTVIPGEYKLDEGGIRCPHIHIKIGAPGYKTLTTQLYFPDNQYNSTDHWFDPRRVLNLEPLFKDEIALFDFVLEKE